MLFILSCNKKNDAVPLFQLEKNSGIVFTNTVQDNDSINILNYRNFYNGGGVAAGDINNDGLADIFFTANQGSNKLFFNKEFCKFHLFLISLGFLFIRSINFITLFTCVAIGTFITISTFSTTYSKYTPLAFYTSVVYAHS